MREEGRREEGRRAEERGEEGRREEGRGEGEGSEEDLPSAVSEQVSSTIAPWQAHPRACLVMWRAPVRACVRACERVCLLDVCQSLRRRYVESAAGVGGGEGKRKEGRGGAGEERRESGREERGGEGKGGGARREANNKRG